MIDKDFDTNPRVFLGNSTNAKLDNRKGHNGSRRNRAKKMWKSLTTRKIRYAWKQALSV